MENEQQCQELLGSAYAVHNISGNANVIDIEQLDD
jgi:hypothetical protein